MGEQKGSLFLVVISLVLFGVMIFVAKPMMENMMSSINEKMQNTINSVNTGIPGSFGLNTAVHDEYITKIVG